MKRMERMEGGEGRKGGDPTGTVSHIVQSLDSDSDAFFMVIETAVDGHPSSGWGGKKKTKELISSLKHCVDPNKHVKSKLRQAKQITVNKYNYKKKLCPFGMISL